MIAKQLIGHPRCGQSRVRLGVDLLRKSLAQLEIRIYNRENDQGNNPSEGEPTGANWTRVNIPL